MKVQAITRYARISPRKVREVTLEIQGLPVERALTVVDSIPRKAARMVGKTLRSAVANAETNANLSRGSLRVVEAIAGTGPTLKRYTARARGSGSQIRKRTSHIKIVLSDEAKRVN
ncbi:MAG: 50S ribosomal protein L22 [Verrucomicrobiae bacterium]|nr:50S ribosomal protein L22 [Verrucomicrobiae bacterium]